MDDHTGRRISIHVVESVESGKRDETELRERHTITSELTIPHDFSFTSLPFKGLPVVFMSGAIVEIATVHTMGPVLAL